MRISGNAGNGILNSESHVNTLSSGGSADTFVFNLAAMGQTNVTDLTHATDPLEILAGGLGGGLMAGATSTTVTAASAAAPPNPGTSGYFTSGNAGADAALWDPIGGGGSDATAVAIFHNLLSIHPSDFHLI